MTDPAGAAVFERRGDLVVIPRRDFAENYFDYKAGEHVVFGGPTRKGKTTLAFDLLEHCATPELPAYVAVSKPTDPTTEAAGKRLGFRRVQDWPPPHQVSELWDGRPAGYLIWPKFGDIDSDVNRSAYVTSRLIRDRYAAGARRRRGRGILVMDDTMVKSRLLGLDGEMTTVLAMAGAMGLGQWTFVQKPTDSGRAAIWSYGASEHLFLTKDPDRKNRTRYDEIGGFDTKTVAEATRELRPFEFLYLNRTGGYMCIVGAA